VDPPTGSEILWKDPAKSCSNKPSVLPEGLIQAGQATDGGQRNRVVDGEDAIEVDEVKKIEEAETKEDAPEVQEAPKDEAVQVDEAPKVEEVKPEEKDRMTPEPIMPIPVDEDGKPVKPRWRRGVRVARQRL
jgi:hypothetical protein